MRNIREATGGVVLVHGTPAFTDKSQRRVSNHRTGTALERNIGLRERSTFLACLQNQLSILNPHSVQHPRSVIRSVIRFFGLGIAALSINFFEWLGGFILPNKLNKILWRKNKLRVLVGSSEFDETCPLIRDRAGVNSDS
jgi:hypothetical protein